MRALQILTLALLAVAARADNFIYTINPATQTVTMDHQGSPISWLDGGTGALAVSFQCGGIANTRPTFCDLGYVREEFLKDPSCDPVFSFSCFNDGVFLFRTVAVVDGAGNAEAFFEFYVFSHSIVAVALSYDFDVLPSPPDPSHASAFVVDTGRVETFDAIIWDNGLVDTFQAQIVPEPSSLILFSSALLCGLYALRSHRIAKSA